MNLGSILNEIKLLVPPSADITDDQLVQRINQVQRKVYRELPLPDKTFRTTTTPASPFYELPLDCAEDRIKSVIVDNRQYDKLGNQDTTSGNPFCTVVMDTLYLNPNPTNEVELIMYYKPRYHDLNASNSGDVPDLPEDYHELLVFGCAQWVASTQRDVDMVNNMQAEYEDLLKDAKGYFRQFSPKRVLLKEMW